MDDTWEPYSLGEGSGMWGHQGHLRSGLIAGNVQIITIAAISGRALLILNKVCPPRITQVTENPISTNVV
jgi:hypothetical protein